jgi:hypothetical protein
VKGEEKELEVKKEEVEMKKPEKEAGDDWLLT